MVEHQCTWIGFLGYLFALLFFTISVISAFLGLLTNIKIGKRFGWNISTNKNDFFLNTPKKAIMTYIFIIMLASYLFVYKIAFIILPPYWKCLMG